MKTNLLYIFILCLFVGCSQNESVDNNNAGTKSKAFTFNVGISTSVGTNGTASRAGGDNTIPSGATMRFVLEVFVKGSTNCILHQVRTTQDNAVYTTGFNFADVRLPIGNEYTAICWADFGGDYYNADNLQDINQIYDRISIQNNAEDAYGGMIEFSIDKDGVVNKTLGVTLKRVLNKIHFNRVILNEATYTEDEVNSKYDYNYTLPYDGTSINIMYDKVYTHYNAYTQKVIHSDDVNYYRTMSFYIPVSSVSNISFYDYLFGDTDGNYSVNCWIRYNGFGYDSENANHYYGILVTGNNIYSPINILFPSVNKCMEIKKADDDVTPLNLYYRRISTLNGYAGYSLRNPWTYGDIG